jgi:hypothetical protein
VQVLWFGGSGRYVSLLAALQGVPEEIKVKGKLGGDND